MRRGKIAVFLGGRRSADQELMSRMFRRFNSWHDVLATNGFFEGSR